jgi:glycosyltransferase 2 family protein
MHVVKKSNKHSHHYISIVYLCLLALLLYVIIPQVSTFRSSIPLLQQTQAHWLLFAITISIVAHIAAGFKYVSLALRPIRVFPTVLVQLAGLLVNRLLPIGIGGIGVNYLYLYKAKHTKLQAGVVVTMNNLVGFVGHMLLVLWLLLVAPDAARLRFGPATLWLIAMLALAVLAVFVLLHSRFKKAARNLLASLKQYATRPGKILLATAWSVVIAASYAACLYFSALALGVHITLIQALVVLTLGVAASTVSPTPGGLVGVEAALVGGLVAYKVPSAEALAVALLFRLITYWFALLLGALAFIWTRKEKYI